MDDKILQTIKSKEIRLTPQRMAIFDLIFGNENHPSAEDIYQNVRLQFPTISLATFYKTFKLLKDNNMVSEIPFGTSSRFDPNKVIHINVICPICNKITDLESPFIMNFYNSIEEEIGGGIIDSQFSVFKKCSSCL